MDTMIHVIEKLALYISDHIHVGSFWFLMDEPEIPNCLTKK